MLEGLNGLIKQREDSQAIAAEDRIRRLYLRDGETAVLRFLSDGDDVISAYFHTIEENMPQGKRYRKKYCTKTELGSCQFCAEGNVPGLLIFLWTYVYRIFHRQQNFRLERNPDADKWEPIKVGSQVFYKENVNGPMAFQMSPGRSDYLKDILTSYWTDYKTLCDRDYKWTRNGASLDTTYSLIPQKEEKMSKEIVDSKQNLPSLSDYVSGKIYSFSQLSSDASPSSEDEKPSEVTDELF